MICGIEFSVVVPILIFAGYGRMINRPMVGNFPLFIPYLANIFLQERRVTLEEREVQPLTPALRIMGLQSFKMSPGWLTFILGLARFSLAASCLPAAHRLRPKNVVSESSVDSRAIGPSIPTSFRPTKPLSGIDRGRRFGDFGIQHFYAAGDLGDLGRRSSDFGFDQWLMMDIPLLMA